MPQELQTKLTVTEVFQGLYLAKVALHQYQNENEKFCGEILIVQLLTPEKSDPKTLGEYGREEDDFTG